MLKLSKSPMSAIPSLPHNSALVQPKSLIFSFYSLELTWTQPPIRTQRPRYQSCELHRTTSSSVASVFRLSHLDSLLLRWLLSLFLLKNCDSSPAIKVNLPHPFNNGLLKEFIDNDCYSQSSTISQYFSSNSQCGINTISPLSASHHSQLRIRNSSS